MEEIKKIDYEVKEDDLKIIIESEEKKENTDRLLKYAQLLNNKNKQK